MYNTRLLYPLSSNPPKMYSLPLMLAPQLPDMEVGNSPSIRCIVLQFQKKTNKKTFSPSKQSKCNNPLEISSGFLDLKGENAIWAMSRSCRWSWALLWWERTSRLILCVYKVSWFFWRWNSHEKSLSRAEILIIQNLGMLLTPGIPEMRIWHCWDVRNGKLRLLHVWNCESSARSGADPG